jgi:hypothetical protein
MFSSIKNFYGKSIADWQFNSITNEELEENIFSIYESMMEQYEQTKKFIPRSNLIEVKFEDLENRPLEIIKNIYDKLGIKGFEKSQADITSYINSQKNYEKNNYRCNKELTDKIFLRWGKDIERWNYDKSNVCR